MIEIKGTKYCIDQDSYNYIICLNKPKSSTDGIIRYPQIAFYSDLEGCLDYILAEEERDALKTDEMISLEEAFARIREAGERVSNIISESLREVNNG